MIGKEVFLYASFENLFSVSPGEPMTVVCSYAEHQSLAYGVDWCRMGRWKKDGPRSDPDLTLASCSFYDHSLHVWTAQMPTL